MNGWVLKTDLIKRHHSVWLMVNQWFLRNKLVIMNVPTTSRNSGYYIIVNGIVIHQLIVKQLRLLMNHFSPRIIIQYFCWAGWWLTPADGGDNFCTDTQLPAEHGHKFLRGVFVVWSASDVYPMIEGEIIQWSISASLINQAVLIAGFVIMVRSA